MFWISKQELSRTGSGRHYYLSALAFLRSREKVLSAPGLSASLTQKRSLCLRQADHEEISSQEAPQKDSNISGTLRKVTGEAEQVPEALEQQVVEFYEPDQSNFQVPCEGSCLQRLPDS